MASMTSDTGDTSSKQQQAQRNEIYSKSKRPISSVDLCVSVRDVRTCVSLCVCVHAGICLFVCLFMCVCVCMRACGKRFRR